MRILGNILWIIFGGGIFLFLEYLLGGVTLCLTIIGIPFGIQCIKLSLLALLPFGKTVSDSGTANGCLAVFMNILWIIFGGFWVALTHVLFAFLTGITIIGLPFAKQHMKLAGLALVPFGREIRRIR